VSAIYPRAFSRLRFEPLEDRRLLSVGISGTVWNDLNANGIQDAGERGIAGAAVQIFSSPDAVIGNADDVLRGTAVTDADGNYAFAGLMDGTNYYAVFRAPVGYAAFSAQNVGSDDALDSDANAQGVTGLLTASSTTTDAGLTGAAPGFGWAQKLPNKLAFYNNTPSNASLIATDGQGNVYVAGTLDGTIDFDSGPGTSNAVGNGSSTFVAKYTHAGALIWAKSFSGYWNAPSAIALCGDGGLFAVGSFGGTVDFDPGANTLAITSKGAQDAYVVKLDVSGNLVWVKTFGGTLGTAANGVAAASDGSVYLTGSFDGTTDFNPGAGTYALSAPDGTQAAFVLKLDAAGNLLWAENLSGVSYVTGVSVALDADENVYVAGNYADTAAFNSWPFVSEITSAGSDDVFIAKLSPAGGFLWIKSMGGADFDNVNGLTVAPDGTVLTTGLFSGTADFDPGAGAALLTSAGLGDVFISKLNADGAFVWAKAVGGAGDDWGQGVALDINGGVYVNGKFRGAVDFDPGAGTFNLTSAGTDAGFVLRLDADGAFSWAGATGSPVIDASGRVDNLSQSIALGYDGAIYTTGQFEGTADFDPGAGAFNLTGTLLGGDNGYLAKFNPASFGYSVPVLTINAPAWTNNPRPSGTATAKESGIDMPDGTTVLLDVDINNDGDFDDLAERGFLTSTLIGGTAVFTPAFDIPDGAYRLRARAANASGDEGLSPVVTMVVAASGPTIALTPPTAAEGIAFSNVAVANFKADGLGAYAATITWGDGSTTTVTTAYSPNGYIVQHDPSDLSKGFDVVGAHTYDDEWVGATFKVEVTDGGAMNLSAEINNFSVADRQLTNLTAANLPGLGTARTALAAITGLATFTDPSGAVNETIADYTATIDWGDTTTSIGTIVALGGGNFRVDAPAHTYQHVGYYTVNVTLKHHDLPAVVTPNQSISINSPLPVVLSTLPSLADGTYASAGGTQLQIVFNMAMTGLGTAANYELRALGPDRLLGTADDVILPLNASGSGTVATLTFPRLTENIYRLTVKDAITSSSGGVKLDGDDDGTAGGNWVADFVVLPNGALFSDVRTSTTATNPRAIVTGDFNNDGRLDLAVTNYTTTGQVGIL